MKGANALTFGPFARCIWRPKSFYIIRLYEASASQGQLWQVNVGRIPESNAGIFGTLSDSDH